MSAAHFTEDWVLRYAQCSKAFGDQKFKRHFVPFNYFAALSIQALHRSVQKRIPVTN
jgi:hypothetical protein